MSGARESLLRLLDPVAREAGVDLEDIQVIPAGRRRVVRVLVDRDGGIVLDDVAEVSRRLSDALDSAADAATGLGGSPYVLEVSSPGVDRPLTEARHWRRAVGRLVRVDLVDGARVEGRLSRADDDELEVDGRLLATGDVARGHVQVEFARSDEADDVAGAGEG